MKWCDNVAFEQGTVWCDEIGHLSLKCMKGQQDMVCHRWAGMTQQARRHFCREEVESTDMTSQMDMKWT